MYKFGWLLGVVGLTMIANASAHAQMGWQMAPPFPKPMGELIGAVVGDDWYVMAGLDVTKYELAGLVYAFDSANQRWVEKKKMAEPAHHVMVTAAGGKIYVFGGFVKGNPSGEKTAEAGWRPIDSCGSTIPRRISGVRWPECRRQEVRAGRWRSAIRSM